MFCSDGAYLPVKEIDSNPISTGVMSSVMGREINQGAVQYRCVWEELD